MEKLVTGSLGNYLTMGELDDLLGSMLADYEGEVVYRYEYGTSYEGRPLTAYAFMLGTSQAGFEKELVSRRSILIDAVHHARELTTISQVVYTMLALLHGYEHGNPEYAAMMQ